MAALSRAREAEDRLADEKHEVVAALYKAWPDAEDIPSDWPLGVIGCIEQIIRERDEALAAPSSSAEPVGDFGWALKQMRAGRKVRRPTWTWNELAKEWIALKGGKIVDEDGKITAFNGQEPLLATDWVLADA